jgi:Zn-dependent protease
VHISPPAAPAAAPARASIGISASPAISDEIAAGAALAPGATATPAAALPATAAPPDLLELATLDELNHLQNKTINWRSTIVLLLISALVFIVIARNSGAQQTWEFVAILVGVLLFHELGHYVAMKLFGYRNLRMFFIPGFGAAVSGRHYNAPAWKRIIVSLMGPLPGIIGGTILLILSGLYHNDLLYRIGQFALVINAFNLIPILPLDGGRVAHAALFRAIRNWTWGSEWWRQCC